MCQTDSSSSGQKVKVTTVDESLEQTLMGGKIKDNEVESHSISRSGWVDFLCFLAPLLFIGVTDVMPIMVTGVCRVISTQLTLMLHYLYVDKDNYNVKLSQKQLLREKKDYI